MIEKIQRLEFIMRMYTYAATPRRHRKKWPVFIGIALVIIGVVWLIVGNGDDSEAEEQTPESQPNTVVLKSETSNQNPVLPKNPDIVAPTDPKANETVYGPKGMTRSLASVIGPSPITTPPVNRKQAAADFREGMNLYSTEKDLIKARTLINRALHSGTLGSEKAEIARKTLTDLANRTILREDSYVNPKDPYLISYEFNSDDRLLSIRDRNTRKVIKPGVIARHHLNVPHRIVTVCNNLASSEEYKQGCNYKLIKGPFHVVVHKNQHAADIYLQDLFLKRVPVCLGAAETPTPEGYFRVTRGGKTHKSPYTPPAETGLTARIIRLGQPGYPLGPNGLNIKIEGIPELGTTIQSSQSYALHGTADPGSLGKNLSRGCVRLGDDDIKFLFYALQDYAPINDPIATWTRWSTITVKK